MNYKELGRRIREVRRQKNLTQAALAEKIGVSTSFIGHIERGSRKLSLETFVHLCIALETDPNDLLSFSVDHFPSAPPLTAKEKEQLYALLHYARQIVRADQ